MWIPSTEGEILAAIAIGDLHETASFEAKRQLPEKNKNIDLAIDVAAMSTDGGVIIYGLDEDENHFITTTSPIPLAGTRERISSIIQSSVSEVPSFSVRPIQNVNDPGLGYIILIVPPSTRAPHMVIVRGDHRFYGRSDTGNRLLNEAEVARLYHRRASVEIDFTQELRQEIEASPIPLTDDRGHLYLLAKPVLPNTPLLDDAIASSPAYRDLLTIIVNSARELPIRRDWAPDVDYVGNWQRVLEGFRSSDAYARPNDRLEFQFDYSGAVHLFCGRGADTLENGMKVVFSSILAGLTMRFVFMAGRFYESTGYMGNVKLGILLNGIERAVLFSSVHSLHRIDAEPFSRNEYIRTTSAAATSLSADFATLASELVMPLIAVMSREHDNPFRTLLQR